MKEEVRREKEMNVEVLLYEYLAALKVINTEFTYTFDLRLSRTAGGRKKIHLKVNQINFNSLIYKGWFNTLLNG